MDNSTATFPLAKTHDETCFCVECLDPAGTGRPMPFCIRYVRDGVADIGPELYGAPGFAETCRRSVLRAAGVTEALVLWLPVAESMPTESAENAA